MAKHKNTEKKLVNKYILLRTFIIVVVTYFIASCLDIFESLAEFVESHESYNLDELIIVAAVLTFWLFVEMVLLVRRSIELTSAHEERSLMDPMTGLLNRRGLFAKSDITLKTSPEHTCYVYYIDIRNFKFYNDNYGHALGDDVITSVADYLNSLTSEGDVVARIGGDEFTLIVNRTESQAIALLELLRYPLPLQTTETIDQLTIHIDAGISAAGINGDSLDELLSAADKRMYKQKNKEVL